MNILIIALILLFAVFVLSLVWYEKSEDKGEKSKWLIISALVSVLAAITYFFFEGKRKSEGGKG